MENNPIRIIIANDHSLFRNGLIKILSQHAPHVQVVGEARGFEELLMLLPQLKADILMTDDAMPERKLLSILPLIKGQYPELKIIINSMLDANYDEESKKIRALAEGWVRLTATIEEFIIAIETVNASKTYYDV